MSEEWWVNRQEKEFLVNFFFESLILAQDKRWRRALGMQIKGAPQGATGGRVSNAWEST